MLEIIKNYKEEIKKEMDNNMTLEIALVSTRLANDLIRESFNPKNLFKISDEIIIGLLYDIIDDYIKEQGFSYIKPWQSVELAIYLLDDMLENKNSLIYFTKIKEQVKEWIKKYMVIEYTLRAYNVINNKISTNFNILFDSDFRETLEIRYNHSKDDKEFFRININSNSSLSCIIDLNKAIKENRLY